MPKRYPPEFRGAVCARLVAGEKVRTMQFELREAGSNCQCRERSPRVHSFREATSQEPLNHGPSIGESDFGGGHVLQKCHDE
jgi:hypothetical protein